MTRDRVESEELAHDLSQDHSGEFEAIKEQIVDDCNSGENTDWIEKEWAHELLAEIWGMMRCEPRALDFVRNDGDEKFRCMVANERLRQMFERAAPYIEKYAALEAGKQVDLSY